MWDKQNIGVQTFEIIQTDDLIHLVFKSANGEIIKEIVIGFEYLLQAIDKEIEQEFTGGSISYQTEDDFAKMSAVSDMLNSGLHPSVLTGQIKNILL